MLFASLLGSPGAAWLSSLDRSVGNSSDPALLPKWASPHCAQCHVCSAVLSFAPRSLVMLLGHNINAIVMKLVMDPGVKKSHAQLRVAPFPARL